MLNNKTGQKEEFIAREIREKHEKKQKHFVLDFILASFRALSRANFLFSIRSNQLRITNNQLRIAYRNS